jgi:hypothetical protein
MLNKLVNFFQENKVISVIIFFILIKFLSKKNKTIEKMTQLASTCKSNLYELVTKNQVLVVRELEDNNSNKYYKVHLVDNQDFVDNFYGDENQLILTTPGDNNYAIKYKNSTSEGMMFLSYSENSSLIELNNTSKRFKFINAKEAGVTDAEDGDYLLSTEFNKYVVQKDSFNLGFDKNDLILNTNLIQGKTKEELSKLNTSDFVSVPVFKLTCIN